jgi:hypothetical protein
MNIEELIEEARKDPNVLTTIDIEELLENTEDIDEENLEGKTMSDFMQENHSILSEVYLDRETEIKDICDKLKDYRYIERICDLRPGRHIRWINTNTQELKLGRGGTLIKIEILNNKTTVLCKNYRFFMRCVLDNCLVFQKFTIEEQLLLMLQGK